MHVYEEQVFIFIRVMFVLSEAVYSYEDVKCFIMSYSLLWRRIVLLTVGVYSSNHRVL